jgi:hypothetical protein
MSEPVLALVPLSILEYQRQFPQLAWEHWKESSKLVSSLLAAFAEWRVGLADISIVTNPSNLSEAQVTVQLLQNRYVLIVGLGSARFHVWNPSWAEAPTIMRVGSAAISALAQAGLGEATRQEISIAMHMTPQGVPAKSLTRQFKPELLSRKFKSEIDACGAVLYAAERSWQVDLSANYPDSLFAKVTRFFDSSASLEQVASELRSEEDELLALLNLRVP